MASAGGLSGVASASGSGTGPSGSGETNRNLLHLAPEVMPRNLIVQASSRTADVGGGVRAPTLPLNGSLPGPLLRIRQGDLSGVTLQNQIGEPLILHWHGLTPPETMDGRPRFAVASSGTNQYRLTVGVRVGTYWYHPHTHIRAAEQTYRGLAGMLIVGDAEEDALTDFMAGYMGAEPFDNRIRRPFPEVDSALYWLRILNGSNVRIFRLGRSDGRALTLIGIDGGLLARPETLASMDWGPAERRDILLDLSAAAVGDRVMLRSLPFSVPGGGGFMGGANLQGQPMDLLDFRVTRRLEETIRIPSQLSTPRGPQPADAIRQRSFRLTSMMMNHQINGTSFQMGRVNERIPFGDTESGPSSMTAHFLTRAPPCHPVPHPLENRRPGGGGTGGAKA